MFERKSLTWPITLAVVMIVLIGGLTVGWVLLNVFGMQKSQNTAPLYITLLSIGSVMFAMMLTGVIMYLILSIKQYNLNSRQSNFIDAVTHELKSPVTSLKLYLQTLNRRNIDESQRQQFYGGMLSEVERLDQLISQLLDVGRITHQTKKVKEPVLLRIDDLLDSCIKDVCHLHQFDIAHIETRLDPVEFTGHKVDLEIVFRNLIDNAVKYAGTPPKIKIKCSIDESSNLLATIENNGASVPKNRRRQIFKRFYRIGSELERTKPGVGLGLYLVKLIVRRLRGTVSVSEPEEDVGTRITVSLPNARLASPRTRPPAVLVD
jgi:signal transduction histidine kinase